MPTMIDSLFVALKLDSSEFTKGQKEASSALAKTKDETRKAATEIESSGKSAGEAIEGLSRRFIALFALLAGARSVKDFTAQIVGADSAIGRLAANLGTTPDRLDAMTSAVERNGGSAGAAASSFRSLSDSFEELKNTGNTGILVMLQRLQGQGGATIDMMHGFDKALPGIVNNLTAMKAKGDAVGANWFGRQLGIDEETVNFLQQGWPKVQAEIEKSKRLGVVSPESAAAAQKMMQSWMSLQQAARDLGRTILTDLSPPIQHAMDGMTAWVERNKGWIDQKIGDAVRAFGSTVSEVAHSPGFQDLIQAVSDPSNWKPFTDWVREMGRPETWKEFKGALSWLGGQLREIRDAIRQIKGFINWADQNPVLRKIDEAAGLRAPAADAAGGDPMALANGPYAKPRTVGGKIAEAYRNNMPRFLGGRDRSDPDDASQRHSRPGHRRPSVDTAGSSAGDLTKLTEEAAREAGIDPRIMHGIRAGESGHGGNYDIGDGKSSFGPWQLHYGGINPSMPRPGLGDQFTKETGLDARDPKTIAAQTRWVAHWLKTHSPVGTWFGYHGNRDASPKWGNAGYVPDPPKPAKAPTVVAAKPGTELPDFHSGQAPFVGYKPTKPEPDNAEPSPKKPAAVSSAVPPVAAPSPTAKAISDAIRPIPPAFTRIGLGAPGAAAAANISNDHRSTSNSHEVNVGNITVQTQATDSTEIAKSIKPAIERHSFATHANYGPA